MINKIIGIDVDDVVADLIPAWLDLYNKDYADELTAEDITDWDISKFVIRKCGQKIYDYLDLPMLYQNVKQVRGALDGVNELREMGHRIVFVTSTNIHQNGQKLKWLQQNNFLPKQRFSLDYIEATDKSLINCDFIIDDKPDNCNHPTAVGLLFDHPHNRKFDITGYENILRVANWEDTVEIIKNFIDLERRMGYRNE